MRRLILGAAVSAVLSTASLSTASPAASVGGFGDIEESRYYAAAVQWMLDNDITSGTTQRCFSPDAPVSRGQAATFLWRMAGKPEAPLHRFNDVTASYQHAAISWLADEGYAIGARRFSFRPDNPTSRGEFAAMLYRVAGQPDAGDHPYTDVTAPELQQPVAWMTETSITTGTSPTTFSPNKPITRAQIATFLYRYKGSPTIDLDPSSPACGLRSDQLTLHKVGEIRGNIAPKSVVYSGDGLFFAQNMMYRHTVTVYDRSLSLVETISDRVELSAFGVAPANPGTQYQGAPVEAAFTTDSKYAYVSNYRMYGPGYVRPGGDRCSPGSWDNSFLYRINVSSLTIDQVIAVGAVPKFVAVTPDNTKVLVTNWCSYDLSVVDTASATELIRIPIGRYPRGITVSSDSKTAYIAIMGSTEIAVVDLTNLNAPVSKIRNVGSSPRSLLLSPDDRYLYVSLNRDGRVIKFDLKDSQVVGSVYTGSGARSLAMSDDGTAIYVVNYHSDTFSKVRTADMVELQRIATPNLPIGITYDPKTRRVWVSTYSGTIQIYEDTQPKHNNSPAQQRAPLPCGASFSQLEASQEHLAPMHFAIYF